MLLKNKIILITGSTTGIGAATARRCVAEGAQVMLHGRNETHAKALCEQLGANTRYVIGELIEPETPQLIVEATVKAFGAIHGLVNNAAIYPRHTIDTASSTAFDEVMAVNVKAPMLISQAAVYAFRRQKTGGAIVNIGSMNAHCGQPDLLIYSASKGALMTMTRNLADALGHECIRVNQLNVGWTPTETEIALKKSEGLSDDWFEHVPRLYAPTGRLQTPDEVAPHVAFWLSDLSAPTSGAVYEIEQYPIIGRNRISDMKLL